MFRGVASALEIFDKRLNLILEGIVEKTMPNSQRQQVLHQCKAKTNIYFQKCYSDSRMLKRIQKVTVFTFSSNSFLLKILILDIFYNLAVRHLVFKTTCQWQNRANCKFISIVKSFFLLMCAQHIRVFFTQSSAGGLLPADSLLSYSWTIRPSLLDNFGSSNLSGLNYGCMIQHNDIWA